MIAAGAAGGVMMDAASSPRHSSCPHLMLRLDSPGNRVEPVTWKLWRGRGSKGRLHPVGDPPTPPLSLSLPGPCGASGGRAETLITDCPVAFRPWRRCQPGRGTRRCHGRSHVHVSNSGSSLTCNLEGPAVRPKNRNMTETSAKCV